MESVKRVCYANPTILLRRPISELLALQEGKRRLGLLIPSRGAEHERQLHHTKLFTEAEVLTYKVWRLPGAYEWPIPRCSFFKQVWKMLGKYDIVHAWAHFYLSTLIIILLSRLKRRRPRIILTMDTLPGYSFSAGSLLNVAFRLWTWTFGRIVYGLPDSITLYGEALLPHAKRSGIDMKKVKVIPTGIMEYALPTVAAARKRIMQELRIKKKTRIILYAGLLNPRKRVEDALAVAAELPDALFLIAGDGQIRKKLERQAQKLTNVRFLGWRDDFLVLMRAADVFLFPSGAEGLPGVVMEAMYCGTPIVTTRIPCTTDLIRNKKEGVLCEVGDVHSLRKGITGLLQREKVAKRLSRAAQKRIRRFLWKERRSDWLSLYS